MPKIILRTARRTVAAAFLLALTAAAFGAQVRVQIQNARLKKAPQWFAATVAGPALGDQLEVVKQAGDWYQVRAGDTVGWIHKSAVTSKKMKKSQAATVGATQTTDDDVTLAAKGFNKLEAEYRKSGGNVNLEAIDAMEARLLDEAKVIAFLRKGALLPPAVGRKK